MKYILFVLLLVLISATSIGCGASKNNKPTYISGGAIRGQRSKEDIVKTVTTCYKDLRILHLEKLKSDSLFTTIIKTRFEINGSGQIIKFEILESNNPDEQFEQDVSQIVKKLDFGIIDQKEDVTELVYPFVFKK